MAGIAGLVFVAAVIGLYSGGGSSHKGSVTATTATSTSTTVRRVLVPEFGTVAFTVNSANGQPTNRCALLAESSGQLATGLMQRKDLSGYDAMVFRFGADTKAAFYMANVPMPLSVAWFDSAGKFVSSADMATCDLEAAKCPRYSADGPYRFAIEVPKGGLSGLGVGAGSSVTLGSTCA